MEPQKEALQRVISTLTNKNEELKNLLRAVDEGLSGLKDESQTVMSQLEAELEELRSALEERGAYLHDIIREEERQKEVELQRQLAEVAHALQSGEELLAFATQSLTIEQEDDFLQAARQIRERVTMAPAFRLSARLATSPSMARFTVDFSAERAGLQQLRFLPVPSAPQVDAERCCVSDNAITASWRAPEGAGAERYELQHRSSHHSEGLGAGPEACWERVCDITGTQVTVSGLKFDAPFVIIRVRARNKAAAGEFSEPVVMETRAFSFGLDAATAHPELRVQGDTATWEPHGVKGHEARLKGKDSKGSRSSTPSPNKLAAARCGRERFAGESYTVLGDREVSGGAHYWEVRPLADWKSLSVGVAHRGALGRFDQLGKSASSWCLSASQWLQTSLAAKHSNRARTLDAPLPRRVGVYCHHDNGDLLFIDVDRLSLLHAFRAKFSQPLVPAFTVWCGGVAVTTGLQVPSFMENFLATNRSLSSLSHDQPPG